MVLNKHQTTIPTAFGGDYSKASTQGRSADRRFTPINNRSCMQQYICLVSCSIMHNSGKQLLHLLSSSRLYWFSAIADVYYQLQAGPWVRSVVQLKELLQPTATTTTAATTTLGAAANLAGLVIPAPLGSASAIADDGLHSYQRTPHSPSSRATPTSAAVAALPDMSSAALPSIATPPSSGHRKCGKLEVVTRDDPEQWQEMESYIRRGWSDVTASDLGRIAAGKCLIRQSGIHEGEPTSLHYTL